MIRGDSMDSEDVKESVMDAYYMATGADSHVNSRKERINQTPKNGGEWKNELGLNGNRGTGKFYPTDERKTLLSKYGERYICYDRTGEPDFLPFTQAEVKLANMEGGDINSRQHNFANADKKLLGSDWAEKRGLRTQTDIKRYRKEHCLTWHEKSDGITIQLIPSEINRAFGHAGGVSEIGNMDAVDEAGLRKLGHEVGKAKIRVRQKGVKAGEVLGVEGAKSALQASTVPIVMEGIDCVIKVASEEMTAKEAVISMGSYTAAIGAGGAISQISTQQLEKQFERMASKTASETIKKLLSPKNIGPTIAIATSVSKSVIRYVNGQISTDQMIGEIMKDGAMGIAKKVIAMAPFGPAAAAVMLEIMVIGSACAYISDYLNSYNVYRADIAVIQSIIRNAEAELQQVQVSLQEICDREVCIIQIKQKEGFQKIIKAIVTNDIELAENGMNTILDLIDEKVVFTGVPRDEFKMKLFDK